MQLVIGNSLVPPPCCYDFYYLCYYLCYVYFRYFRFVHLLISVLCFVVYFIFLYSTVQHSVHSCWEECSINKVLLTYLLSFFIGRHEKNHKG